MPEKIKKFWELHKLSQTQDKTTKIKTQVEIISIAKEIINSGCLKENDKFFSFISKFAQATPIKNKDGVLIFIRFLKQENSPTSSKTPYVAKQSYPPKNLTPKSTPFQMSPKKHKVEDSVKFELTPNTTNEEDLKLIKKFKPKPFKI